MKPYLRFLAACLMAAAMTLPVAADVKMVGTFTASKACPAFKSIKKQKNPGNVMVEPGQTYDLRARNAEDASYYLVEILTAQPPQRWVATECGTVKGTEVAQPPAVDPGTGPVKGAKPFFVLAVSWQPAFCESYPDKSECRRLQPDSIAARQLSLHGLWPQPSRVAYCGDNAADIERDKVHRWYDLPAPELSPATRAALDAAMPGTQSVLERHEWIKHGTCYPGANAETYFKDALRVLDAVNGSPVREFLAANIGRKVTGADLRAKFDEAFGPGAGERVRLSCDTVGGRQLLVELTIGLKGDITAGTPVGQLIAASAPTDPGCPWGIVDPAGRQ